MKREERWKALAEATDVMQAAEAQLEREATRQTRDAWQEADRVYQLRLVLVIGLQPVQMYAKRVQAYLEAIDRAVRLNATMSRRTADDADVTFMEGLAGEQIAAQKAWKIAVAEVVAAVERARAHDNEPDEKGGA